MKTVFCLLTITLLACACAKEPAPAPHPTDCLTTLYATVILDDCEIRYHTRIDEDGYLHFDDEPLITDFCDGLPGSDNLPFGFDIGFFYQQHGIRFRSPYPIRPNWADLWHEDCQIHADHTGIDSFQIRHDPISDSWIAEVFAEESFWQCLLKKGRFHFAFQLDPSFQSRPAGQAASLNRVSDRTISGFYDLEAETVSFYASRLPDGRWMPSAEVTVFPAGYHNQGLFAIVWGNLFAIGALQAVTGSDIEGWRQPPSCSLTGWLAPVSILSRDVDSWLTQNTVQSVVADDLGGWVFTPDNDHSGTESNMNEANVWHILTRELSANQLDCLRQNGNRIPFSIELAP